MTGRRTFLALLIAGAVLMQAPAAAAAPGLDFTDDRTPNPEVVSASETISEHDLGAMDSPLEVYDDSGEVTELPATYNESQDAPFGLRYDKVEADAYTYFPRVDGETDNGATWTAAGQWSSDANSAVSDADADGVEKLQVDVTAAGGTATFGGSNVSITSDADKRVMMFVGNVDSLGSGAEVQVRAVDSDGDYRYANISSSDAANADYTIANGTGNGFVFQQKLADLPMAGTGDGNMGEIQSVEVTSLGSTATVTIAGLDLEKKSTLDFGTVERDTDGDGDLETTTVEDYHEGGEARLTEYRFGSTFDAAVLHDWTVYDVRYPLSMQDDASQYNTEFSDSSDSSYGNELSITADVWAPNYIDLSHGALSLELDQGLIGERYGEIRVASDVAEDTAIGDLNDSDYTDKSGSVAQKGDTITLVSGPSGDTEYRVDLTVYLKNDEVDALSAPGGMGPTGGGGGFFSTLTGQITGIVASVAGFLGLRRLFGGS